MRKKRIECLEGHVGMVYDTQEILEVASDFYRKLFKWESRGDVSLELDFWGPNEIVSAKENTDLVFPFFEEEIRGVVFGCYPKGAPSPDGLPFLFYQKYWSVIKQDLISMFSDFQEGKLDLFRLNFTMLSLIPKIEGADEMKSFRPISLFNCSFKIFSKALTLRLEKGLS
jgi:hypothetical protein